MDHNREPDIQLILKRMQSKNVQTRQNAVEKLEAIATEEAFQLLLLALDDKNRKVRNCAVSALGYLGDPRALDKLLPLFGVRETYKQLSVSSSGHHFISSERFRVSLTKLIEAVGRIGDARALPELAAAVPQSLSLTDFSDYSFSDPFFQICLSWAIASIAARFEVLLTKGEAARQLIHAFPSEHDFNHHILHRMP